MSTMTLREQAWRLYAMANQNEYIAGALRFAHEQYVAERHWFSSLMIIFALIASTYLLALLVIFQTRNKGAFVDTVFLTIPLLVTAVYVLSDWL